MIIRQGTIEEMMSLWYKRYTTEFFAEKITAGEAEFWAVELDKKLIGELYIFKYLDERHFANGTDTAYLCAFRILKEYRGKGYGTTLIKRVFDRLWELRFKYATIGVEKDESENIRLYQRLGFVEGLGVFKYDPCDVDENSSPVTCREFMLLRKSIETVVD